MMIRLRETVQVGMVVILAAFSARCGGDKAEDDSISCIPGEINCVCNQGQCLAGLVCMDESCVEASAEADTSTDSPTSSSSETNSSTDSDETATDATSTDTNDLCDPPDLLCDGECVDPLNDVSNCGECGRVCKTVLDSGGCVAGECAPVWSACNDATVELISCPAVCQSEGFAECVTAACGANTMSVRWYSGLINCDEGVLATEAEATPCETEPNGTNDDYYRCCCAQ